MKFMLTCDIVKFAKLIYKNDYFNENFYKNEHFMCVATTSDLEMEDFHKLCGEMWKFCNASCKLTMIENLSKCFKIKIIA